MSIHEYLGFFVLDYFMIGLFIVFKDLSDRPIDQRPYVRDPKSVLLVFITWPFRVYVDIAYSGQRGAKKYFTAGIYYSVLFAIFYYGTMNCYKLAGILVDNLFLRIPITIVILSILTCLSATPLRIVFALLIMLPFVIASLPVVLYRKIFKNPTSL